MKRLLVKIFPLLLFYVVLASSMAFGYEEPPVRVLSGQTVAASGTCTYIIDLNHSKYTGRSRLGAFSIQFSGVTCAWTTGGVAVALSGATINASFRMTNQIAFLSGTSITLGLLTGTSTILNNLESTNIVTDLAHDSGNTDYVYGFNPRDKHRFLIVDVTAGATIMNTSAFVDWDI